MVNQLLERQLILAYNVNVIPSILHLCKLMQGSRKRKSQAIVAEVSPSGSDVVIREDAAAPTAGEAGPPSRSALRKLEEEFECVICREMLVAAHTLVPCGHVFCGECLMGWLEKHINCPNCR